MINNTWLPFPNLEEILKILQTYELFFRTTQKGTYNYQKKLAAIRSVITKVAAVQEGVTVFLSVEELQLIETAITFFISQLQQQMSASPVSKTVIEECEHLRAAINYLYSSKQA
jgi:hypothetical protein